MSFPEVMRAYFRGEATEAWFFITPAGLLFAAVGVAVLWQNRTAFDWGLGVIAIAAGLVAAGTGVGIGLRTPGQVAALEAAYESSPATILEDELPRMEKVVANFHTTFYAMGGLVVIGLLLVYAVRREWSSGLGMALIAVGAMGLLIDGVAERRSHPYMKALREVSR
jgi:hypothetical protein